MKHRVYAAALAAIVGAGALLTSAATALASRHSERTWRYLTYGLGGVTAYGAVKGSPTIALLGAAGTAYSYSRWRGDVKRRHRYERYHRYRRYRYYRRPVRYRRYRHYRHVRHYYRYR